VRLTPLLPSRASFNDESSLSQRSFGLQPEGVTVRVYAQPAKWRCWLPARRVSARAQRWRLDVSAQH